MITAVARNYRRLTDEDQRRRVRWVVFGSIASLLPQVALSAGELILGGREVSQFGTAADAASAGIPLVVAYAVVKHRVFDIKVVVRRGLQYLLARRGLQTLLAIPTAALIFVVVRHRNMTIAELVRENTAYLFWIGAALVSLRFRQRLSLWLDRRFFREEY